VAIDDCPLPAIRPLGVIGARGVRDHLRPALLPRSNVFPGARVMGYAFHPGLAGLRALDDRERELLDSYLMTCLPLGEDIATSKPAGPVGFYPFNDSWTDSPCRPGVDLIGDAAGWSDPIIGQGLSIAMRDARLVADVISSADEWSEAAFEGYVVERAERMRRLRISARLQTEMQCVFTEAGRQRRRALFSTFDDDPLLAAATFVTVVGGPDVAPAEAFTPDNTARIRAIA
jgi:2-polyprenyl-6-methoxyphenol hydroxylase-like FAD-dependent oxidoreductase